MTESDKSERIDLSSIDSSLQLEEVNVPPSILPSALRRRTIGRFKVKQLANIALWSVLAVAYNAYLGFAIYFHSVAGRELDWCGGLGFLIVMTAIVYLSLFYFYVVKWALKKSRIKLKLPDKVEKVCQRRLFKFGATFVIFLVILIFLIIDTQKDRYRIVLFKLANQKQSFVLHKNRIILLEAFKIFIIYYFCLFGIEYTKLWLQACICWRLVDYHNIWFPVLESSKPDSLETRHLGDHASVHLRSPHPPLGPGPELLQLHRVQGGHLPRVHGCGVLLCVWIPRQPAAISPA